MITIRKVFKSVAMPALTLLLSVSVLYAASTIGAAITTTSTINADGAATFGSTLGVTGATTLSSTLGVTGLSTLTGGVKVSSTGSTISGLVVGYCTLGAVSVTSATTTYGDCTGATGVVNGDRVFVQATSSLPNATVITSASSTAVAGRVNVRFQGNAGAADIAADTVSLSVWAVR